jgi:hypothetical protein
LRFTVTFGAGLEVTTALLGHPSVVLPVLTVVAVGDGELPVEPVPEPDTVAPQAASMKVRAITSETAGKRDFRSRIVLPDCEAVAANKRRWRDGLVPRIKCTLRMRLTPYITICLDFLHNIDESMLMMSACYYLNVSPKEKVPEFYVL